MVTKFECLACGEVSVLDDLPARCPKCGNGNGIVQQVPAGTIPKRAAEETPTK